MAGLFNLTILAVLAALLYNPISRELQILGVFHTPSNTALALDQKLFKIEDTIHCEDLHHYLPANKLFTACEDTTETRFGWFPGLANFGRIEGAKGRGSIHVVDPETLKSSRLEFENFEGPFVTHGIDVIQDSERANAVYIFAVNHLINPEYDQNAANDEIPKARSQIELFHHVLDSGTVRHIRSIRHPLIRTPNDLYAESLDSVYVTNDHFYREGRMRSVEDVVYAARWTDIVHVKIDSLDADAETGIEVSVALDGMHNNNGLGHAQSEMVIASAMGGTFWRAQSNPNHTISILEEIRVDHEIDNPSYYVDPYATDSHDASGYVLGGLSRPIDLANNHANPAGKDGVMVWYVRPVTTGQRETTWETKLLFEDDGANIRTASTAVLVPIKPRLNEAKKAWLFVTGFISESIVALQVEL